jgi:hypothetical protein
MKKRFIVETGHKYLLGVFNSEQEAETEGKKN